MFELGKQYHSEFSGEMGYFLTGESQQLLYNYHSRESLGKIFLILTLFTAFTTILYWLFPDREVPCVGNCWG
jgi:hypothetical protein